MGDYVILGSLRKTRVFVLGYLRFRKPNFGYVGLFDIMHFCQQSLGSYILTIGPSHLTEQDTNLIKIVHIPKLAKLPFIQVKASYRKLLYVHLRFPYKSDNQIMT